MINRAAIATTPREWIGHVALAFMPAPQGALRQGTPLAVPKVPQENGASAPEGSPFRSLRLLAKPRALFLVFCTLTLLHLYALPLSAQSPRAKQIGMHLKCMCRGCEMTAGNCAHPGGSFSGPCDTAKAELREVDDLLAQGKTEQQVIDAFVAKYGTILYVEPPKKGFGLVAWLMPVVYSLVGLALVVFIVRKWAMRPAAAAPSAPKISSEALDRVRAQVDRDTED